jgi:hypothetical protein
MNRVLPLDPSTYTRHLLHAEDRIWVEKNCYVDIWIELLHVLGCEPLAMAPFVLALDFLDDQWTFFKPSHDQLRDLYGVNVEELYVFRPLIDHAEVHVGAGRLISTEADAFWLPDTQGTDYRRQHTKTTIILNEVDRAGGRLGYFHNGGYHALKGEDFARTFRVGAAPDPAFMPLFAEVIQIDRVVRRERADLQTRSRALLLRQHARRAADPVGRFAQRLSADLERLTVEGLDAYHVWAFGTIRQLGAAAEMASHHLRWLEDGALEAAANAFESVSASCKSLILKAARAVNGRRPLDAAPLIEAITRGWQEGMDGVGRAG